MNRTEAIEQVAKAVVEEAFYLSTDTHWIHELRDALALPKDAEPVPDGCETCAQVYQVVGIMWNDTGDDAYIPVLDNLSASANGDKPPHDDLLPFNPKDTAERDALVKGLDYAINNAVHTPISHDLLLDLRAYLSRDHIPAAGKKVGG